MTYPFSLHQNVADLWTPSSTRRLQIRVNSIASAPSVPTGREISHVAVADPDPYSDRGGGYLDD